MLKKWKKTIKLFATTIIVLIYVTIGLFNNEALKGGGKKEKALPYLFDAAAMTSRTLRTVVGYSEEFQVRKELEGRIECGATGSPADGADGADGAEGTQGGSMWTEEENLGLRIFSAYYDQRQEPYYYVRIIGLVRRNSSFYCQIWYESNETTTYVTQKANVREIWSPKWGPLNEIERPAIISCLTPTSLRTVIPSWVSFVDKSCAGSGNLVKITASSQDSGRKNFVICVKPLNLKRLSRKNISEWLGLNFRLGADKVVFYTLNSSEWFFQTRRKDKSLVMKEFKPPRTFIPGSFEESIWHKRKMEVVAYNDCFYSNLYHAKFVIPLDVDEIIVPKTGNNWFEAFRSHFINAKLSEGTKNLWPEDTENYASFSVRNAYFFPEYPKDAIIRGSKLPKREDKVPTKLVKAAAPLLRRKTGTIFERTLRSYRLSPDGDSVKSFIHVGKALSVFNHYAFHVLGEARRQFIFPESVFQLNHYRNSCDPVLIDGCREFLNQVVYDNSLERFRKGAKPFF